MKTLYISDLDGTLLNENKKISEYSSNIINKFIDNDNYFSYATARSLSSAYKVTKHLNLNIPVITYNGVFVIDPNTKQRLLENLFTEEEVLILIKIFEENNIYPNCYSLINNEEKVSILLDENNDAQKHYLNTRKNDKRLRIVNTANDLYTTRGFYYLCMGSKSDLLPICKYLSNLPFVNCILQQESGRSEFYCDIMPKIATKANSISKLKELLEFDKIISFGDGLNDIQMFKISDECYAVSNANQELKNIATAVIDSNDNDAVANWIKKHAL